MSAKLDRIGAEREKARKKRDLWCARFKELDQKYREQENMEIHDMVHMAGLTSEMLAQLLKQWNPTSAPAGELPAQLTTDHMEVLQDENTEV